MQPGIVEVERQVFVSAAGSLAYRQKFVRLEPRQDVVLDVIAGEIADTFCQFECTHGGVRHDLKKNRARRTRRIRTIWIAHEKRRLVAGIFNDLKRPAAGWRGSCTLGRQWSAVGYYPLSRQFQRGCIEMPSRHHNSVI